jgi:Protein of unknown function (DUF4232)
MHLPDLSRWRLAGVTALACATVVLPMAALAATASPAAATAATSRPRCGTADLVVWMTYDQGAAGTFYYTLHFTNLSGHACTLRGHPGVSAVNLRGGRIGEPANWIRPGNGKLLTVRLRSGATATATLALTDVGVFSRADCRPVTAAGLRVYPPNQRTSRVVPYPLGACSAAQVFMGVGIVQ